MSSWNNTSSGKYIHIYPLNEAIGNTNSLRNGELTFEFTQTGVLTYYPNTNTLNPAHSKS
jgi:hypothetical protein